MFEPNGFIKLHRQMLKWGWYSDPAVKAVFIHLLLTAAYAPKDWRGITIAVGQTVTSIKSLSEELGLSERQVRTALEKLKKTGEISVKTTNRFTLITVEKWVFYQHQEDFEANKRQTDDIQAAIKRQQYKNNKNKKKYNNFLWDTVSYDLAEFERKAQELPVYRNASEGSEQ